MSPARTVAVPRARARVYLARAGRLIEAVDWALTAQNADAAAGSAIHCGIAAADSFLIFHLGLRGADTDHRAVVGLIARCSSPRKDAIGHHLVALLTRKNEVEYEDSAVGIGDAQELAQHAHRLLDLVRTELGGQARSSTDGRLPRRGKV
jgi:hypothetical protein